MSTSGGKGYEDVEYNSGAEKRDAKRRDCIRGYQYSETFYEGGIAVTESGEKPEGGFVERNNVRDRL